MKKYFLIIMILIFCACGSNKSNNSTTIPYIFPIKVTSLISNYLNKNEDVSFFYLTKSNNDWNLIFIKCDGCENKNWVKNTNRKVYVNRKFYPLVFGSDVTFSIKETGDYLISTDMDSFSREAFLFHNKYHIIFDQNDSIKYSGW